MFEKLKLLSVKYDEIAEKLADPEIYSDPSRLAALQKEYKELSEVVTLYREYLAAEAGADDAEAMIADGDADIKELAREEYKICREKMASLTEQLKLALLPKDPNDDKNIIVEIRGGAGGEEAALFAGVLYRMYGMYADRRRWKTEVVNANETELGGYREITFSVEGLGAYSRLKYESGVHRVQRVPETESQGRIHTSTVTVAVLPEAEDVEIEIDPTELQIDTFRSGGAGGQHVNKTESAIRITHIPTGLVVECQDERSQYKNKDRAMKILRSKLLEKVRSEQNAEIAAERRSQVGTGDRSERIRTYNYPQSRVTDHRIGLTLYKLESFLNGDMDELIGALMSADQAERLRVSEGGGEA